MNRLLTSILASISLLLALPTQAQTTMTLQSRSSVNHFYYFGGFAISGDEGEDGAPAPEPGGAWQGSLLTGFEQPSLAIAGSDHHDIQYLSWAGHLDESRDQAQSYTFGPVGAGTELHIDGHATSLQTSEVCGISGCFAASELHASTNTLAFEFALDGGSPYTLSGSASGGQYVDLLTWNPTAQRWFPVVHGPSQTMNLSFQITGNLGAGRYQLRNSPYEFRAGGPNDVINAWNATLRLEGAVASVVPEPGAAALLAAGLASLALRRRRGMR